MKKFTLFTLLTGLSCLLTTQASVLMLNFSAGSEPTGTNLTNSPYHEVTPSFIDTTWNNNGNADVSSGLNYADGTSASGVAYNLGVADLDVNTTVNLGSNPAKQSDLGTTAYTGVYAGDSVGKGGIFSGSTSDRIALGLQVTGLAAGTYDVYVTGRNTNADTNSTLPYSYYVGKGTAGANFDFSAYTNESVTFSGNNTLPTWNEGANYSKLTITLSAGEALNIVSNGDGGNSNGGSPNTANRGFLNSVQIVAIPEPNSLILITTALTGLGIATHRRRL